MLGIILAIILVYILYSKLKDKVIFVEPTVEQMMDTKYYNDDKIYHLEKIN